MTRRKKARRNPSGPSIYIADLAAYNAGRLVGAWIEPSSDVDDLAEQIAGCIKGEEWAVHDYDGFPDLGEYPGIESIAAMAEVLEDHDNDVVMAVLKSEPYYKNNVDKLSDYIQENLFCVLKNAERELADYMLDEGLLSPAEFIKHNWIDFEALGRDVRMDFDEDDEEAHEDQSDDDLGAEYAEIVSHDVLKRYLDGDAAYNDLRHDFNIYTYNGQDYVFRVA